MQGNTLFSQDFITGTIIRDNEDYIIRHISAFHMTARKRRENSMAQCCSRHLKYKIIKGRDFCPMQLISNGH